MKLSDAIMLGSTIIKPTWAGPSSDPHSGTGCALQMALLAVGEKHAAYSMSGPDFIVAERIWGEELTNKVYMRFDRTPRRPIDAFCDWVRSVEPREPAEEDSIDPVQSIQTRESEKVSQ